MQKRLLAILINTGEIGIMKLYSDASPGLRIVGIMSLVYAVLIPVGMYNDIVIMDDLSSGLFNLFFSSVVFAFAFLLTKHNSRLKLVSVILFVVLLLFSVFGLISFATSVLTYLLFGFHVLFSATSLYFLNFDDATRSVFS